MREIHSVSMVLRSQKYYCSCVDIKISNIYLNLGSGAKIFTSKSVSARWKKVVDVNYIVMSKRYLK